MGSVVGENYPLGASDAKAVSIIVCASGGARMQEEC